MKIKKRKYRVATNIIHLIEKYFEKFHRIINVRIKNKLRDLYFLIFILRSSSTKIFFIRQNFNFDKLNLEKVFKDLISSFSNKEENENCQEKKILPNKIK